MPTLNLLDCSQYGTDDWTGLMVSMNREEDWRLLGYGSICKPSRALWLNSVETGKNHSND